MRDIERWITIRQIDQAWVYHLANMDYLREGIGLRGYAQMDPLVAYKKEALQLFDEMQGSIQGDVVRNLFFMPLQIVPNTEDGIYNAENEFGPDDLDGYANGGGTPGIAPDMGQSVLLAAMTESAQKAAATPTGTKAGPNDPCPCGSGKKYKQVLPQ